MPVRHRLQSLEMVLHQASAVVVYKLQALTKVLGRVHFTTIHCTNALETATKRARLLCESLCVLAAVRRVCMRMLLHSSGVASQLLRANRGAIAHVARDARPRHCARVCVTHIIEL